MFHELDQWFLSHSSPVGPACEHFSKPIMNSETSIKKGVAWGGRPAGYVDQL